MRSAGDGDPRSQRTCALASSATVVRVRGSVIDVEFPAGMLLPPINEALIVKWDGAWPLLVEVQEHLDIHNVRAVAMQSTAGLRRGTAVNRTGGPIRVP